VKIHEKLLASIRQQSPYLAWAQQGLTPDEVKVRILAILQPHFQNPSVLTEVSIETLGNEAVAIGKIQADPWSASMLAGVLSEYRAALAEDQGKYIEAVGDWDEQIARSTSEFFSLYVMEVDKAELQLDELRLEVLRAIGGLVDAFSEACRSGHLRRERRVERPCGRSEGADCEDIADDRVPFETLASRVRFSVFGQRTDHAPMAQPTSKP
jgi:hypothetical protein